MLNKTYACPVGQQRDGVLEFTKRGVAGAEIFTFVSVNYDSLPAGRIFCAEDRGKIVSVLYEGPDYRVLAERGRDPYEGLALLRFTGSLPPPDPRVRPLTLSDAREMYRVIDGGVTLTPDDEARYVYRARCMRDGFAAGFGIKEGDALLSFAYLVSENEDVALMGDVFTVPSRRREGLAAACISACAAAAAGRKKTLWTLCEEKNRSFYEKLHFMPQKLSN